MSVPFKTFILLIAAASGLLKLKIQQKQNNQPEVKLSLTANTNSLKWNSLVPYTISVSDVEDGKSEYNEIVSNEVLLEVRFIADSTIAKNFIAKKDPSVQEVPLRMAKTLCFNCHGLKTKVIGPSYEQIAKRYKGSPQAEDTLSARIVRGSTGIWSDVKMPPHPDLKKEDVHEIVKWILGNGDDPNLNYFVGLQGAFRTMEKPSESSSRAAYILTASYVDHGPDAREGRSTLVISVH
jgi:cytochrome c